MTDATGHPLTLRVSRTFGVSRDEMFRLWTEPERFARWWGPRGSSTPKVEIDLRVGGAFHIVMRSQDGRIMQITGVYREVRPPERLVYTWHFDGGEETIVEIEFRDEAGATQIVLTHSKFTTEASRSSHEQGWGGCFEHLCDVIASAAPPDPMT